MAPSRDDRERPRLILASASPRRLDLLAQIGLAPDEVVPADVDESVRPRELPRDHAKRLAEEKARAIAAAHPGAFVLGADTVVAVGRRTLGKADDEAHARRYLDLLSGRAHQVYGGVCVVTPDGEARTRLVATRVSFKNLSKAEVAAYLASGEWHDKAGAYAIQGRAAVFVRKIVGSYSNVVGLPLFETSALLEGLGYRPGSGEETPSGA